MYRCPKCREVAYDSAQKPCQVCLGWGVVVNLYKKCPGCGGRGCYKCGQKGRIIDPTPFIDSEIRFIDMERVREAVTKLRTGYDVDPEERGLDGTWYLAVAGRLLELSAEHTEHYGDEPGAWLTRVLEAEQLVIEPTGIWIVHGGMGTRVHRFHMQQA